MAKQSSLQRLRLLIGQERSLAVLLPEAERLKALNDRLKHVLPPAVARSCQVVATANGEARILCASGAAAARIRSQSSTLARALSTPNHPVDRIRVRVEADWSRPDRPAKQGMGRAALSAWNELDHELPSGALKEAVEHLLRHHRASR